MTKVRVGLPVSASPHANSLFVHHGTNQTTIRKEPQTIRDGLYIDGCRRPDASVHNLDPCVSDTHKAPSRQRGPSPHTIPDAYFDMHHLLFEQAISEVLGCRPKLLRPLG